MRSRAMMTGMRDWLGVGAMATAVIALLMGAGWVADLLVPAGGDDIARALVFFAIIGVVMLLLLTPSPRLVPEVGRALGEAWWLIVHTVEIGVVAFWVCLLWLLVRGLYVDVRATVSALLSSRRRQDRLPQQSPPYR
jgi:uncharacterized membrane protein